MTGFAAPATNSTYYVRTNDLEARATAAEADAARYKSLRRLNARQFAELFERNLAGENFDAMVDALLDPATVNAEGESNG
jgi:hypothetical protein